MTQCVSLYHNIKTSKYMETIMKKKPKSNATRQYTVGLEKTLRGPMMKALAMEIENSGEYLSINSLASQLIRIGLKKKYPEIVI